MLAAVRSFFGGAIRSGPSRTNGLTLLPHLLTAGLAQQKIFKNEFAVTSSKRRTTNPARYFAVTGGLRSGFGSNDLIKSVAVRALKKLYPCGSGHNARPQLATMPA